MSEGGGVKGIAYAGALAVLEERGVLARVDAVAGTSAGAITAALVAVGCTPDELRDIMLEVDLTTFEDGRLEGPVRLLEHFGFYRGDAFLSWIHRGIAERCGDPDATFAQVAASKVRELHVVTTDLSTHRPLVFSPATSPDHSLAVEVRMSMSIPLWFAAVQEGGAVLVDGAPSGTTPSPSSTTTASRARRSACTLGSRGHARPLPLPSRTWSRMRKRCTRWSAACGATISSAPRRTSPGPSSSTTSAQGHRFRAYDRAEAGADRAGSCGHGALPRYHDQRNRVYQDAGEQLGVRYGKL